MVSDMAQEVTNFARFYTLLNRMPYGGDKEELKQGLVSEFCHAGTNNLKDITKQEYNAMCAAMERMAPSDGREEYCKELRYNRSVCLKLMQKIGIDTTNWETVNKFCMNPKIAAMEFRRLDIADLNRLSYKLRMILKKQSK